MFFRFRSASRLRQGVLSLDQKLKTKTFCGSVSGGVSIVPRGLSATSFQRQQRQGTVCHKSTSVGFTNNVADDENITNDNVAHTTSRSGEASKCPFTGMTSEPTLKKVPTLPFFGSMLPQYSGIPPFDPKSVYKWERTMRSNYGEFFSFGLPGIGNGLHGIVHSTTSPSEMLKVIRAEGAHPSGVLNAAWTLQALLKEDNSAMYEGDDPGLMGVGERWKKHRTFLQTGMLDPRAAKGFLPGIINAAEFASTVASIASERNEMNFYMNLSAFDMFNSFMFGELTQCTSLYFSESESKNGGASSEANQENLAFCKAAIEAMVTTGKMNRSPMENISYKVFGYETATFKDFRKQWGIVRKIGMKKLLRFIDRYHDGSLSELERNSYMFSAMQRLEKEDGSDISQEEVLELCLFAMFVGVDTTSGVTSWNLMHMALNPEAQQKVFEELSEAVKETPDGRLTAKILEKRRTPYLHAVFRETNRLTPPFSAATFKRASQSDVEIHGVTLPKNSFFMLKNKFNDPIYLDDATEFKPERWMPSEVEARKGTPLEDMDHPIFRDSFGQGARRCPGSRVAFNEVMTMISQLVLDYEIRPPDQVTTLEDVEYGMSALVTPSIPQLQFIPRETESKVDSDIAA